MSAVALPATAVDGCKVLLCLAGNWRNISQCRPDVEQALRDVARGKGWPTCGGMGTAEVDNGGCPEQYRSYGGDFDDRGNRNYACKWTGALEINVDNKPWSRVWWNTDGESVTEWRDFGRASMGANADNQFDSDFEAWLRAKANEPAAPVYSDSGGE